MSPPVSPYYVYILRCSDQSLYIGHTSNLPDRLTTHTQGHGSSHTAAHLPVQLIYQEPHPSALSAIRRERQLKRWSHAKKLALIHGDLTHLKSLAKRHAP